MSTTFVPTNNPVSFDPDAEAQRVAAEQASQAATSARLAAEADAPSDRRTPLSEWFKRPEPTDDQISLLNRNHDEAKAAHEDAKDKLERLNGEVRRFTEALDVPKELETIVASTQAAEVKARVLDGGLAADEAMKVLKIAQKRLDAAITAAREAELVLPDIEAMVDAQRKVVKEKKESLRKAALSLGEGSAVRMLHRGVRGHLTGLLVNLGSLKRIEQEFGAEQPIDIKLELSGIGWFKPEEINPEV